MSSRTQRTQRASAYLGLALAVIIGLSSVLSVIQQNSQQQVSPESQDTLEPPTPTLPVPITNFEGISFDQKYLHPSGLFTVAQPTGWTSPNSSNNGSQAQVTLRNETALSDIEASVETPTTVVNTVQDLDSYFNRTIIESSWRTYTGVRETGRRVNTETDRLEVDFELTQGRQTYLARQVAWTDGTKIYTTRVVTPPNMRDLLLFLIERLPETLQPVALFAESPSNWTALYNPEGGEIIRYPTNWTIVDGEPGSTVSIQGSSNEALRIEVPQAGSVSDEAAAREYVQAMRPDLTINTVEPVERNGATGFAVSYNTTNLEGEGESGLVTLLNGADDQLHIASIHIPTPGVDLNNVDVSDFRQTDAANVMSSFNLTTELGLPIPPTATPTPTPVPVVATQPASTDEASATEESGTDEASTDEPAVTDEAATLEVTATP